MFKHRVTEQAKEIQRSESWTAELGEYDVGVHRNSDGLTEVWVAHRGVDRARLPIVMFHPKSVSDLDRLADVLPDLLRRIAEGMRAEGMNDLRSETDILYERMDAEREQYQPKK